jgi:hypothetical protein
MARVAASRIMRRAAVAAVVVLLAVARVVADPVSPRPLPLDGDVVPTSLTSDATAVPPSTARPLPDWRLLAALATAFAAVGGYRFMAGRTKSPLPTDVFEVLGEATLGAAHSVRVVRFGPRTLLVSVSSAGCQTLAELTDPQATDCIVAACRGSRPRPPAALAAAVRGRTVVPTGAEVRG